MNHYRMEQESIGYLVKIIHYKIHEQCIKERIDWHEASKHGESKRRQISEEL